jgi:hypothetical protein
MPSSCNASCSCSGVKGGAWESVVVATCIQESIIVPPLCHAKARSPCRVLVAYGPAAIHGP